MKNTLFLEAENLRALCIDENEKAISDIAFQIAEKLNLDNECLLSCYLYYPYVKTAIYISPSEQELKLFDEVKRKKEEENKKYIEEKRIDFKKDLETKYGKNTVIFLHALKKLSEISYENQEEEAENIRKMFFALAKDVRVIIVKICFILAEIKHLKTQKNLKQLDSGTTANQVLELFAPLAARLGLSALKSELEDISFSILNPKEYNRITRIVQAKFKEREKTINILKDKIKTFMSELTISGEIMGRKKHYYSIHKKLQGKGVTLDKIYDLIAVRAILPTIADCYALLGKIHGSFLFLQNRFKDYIAMPKSNGYQSLHTTIMFENVPVEIQIRTTLMHKQAEFGVAAHWMYKENRVKQDSLDNKLGWIREIIENEESMTSEDLINTLKIDLFDGEIFVQTPKGKVLHMPDKSTAIDFAYLIHSDIGNKCIGSKVNGKMQPITKPLANGDIIEIITSSTSKGPSRDWLKVVKTPQARNKILSFFRKEMKEENIKSGKIMFEQAIKNAGYSVSKLTEKKYLQVLLEKYNFNLIEELFSAIGHGAYSAKVVSGRLINIYRADIKQQQEKKQLSNIESIGNYNPEGNDKKINVKGISNLMIKFARCCMPMEGDEIIGFLSTGRGIIIHRTQCPNVSFFDPERLIEVEWKSHT